MSKALILVLGLVVCALSATTFDTIKSTISEDACGIHAMETVRPKIENKLAVLKANPDDVKTKSELLALINDVESVYKGCGLDKKVEPLLGDVVEATGIAFLLASNCFKDVGALLLIGDTIIQDPKNITNDTIVLIFLYILGRQGYADCEQFIHYVL